MDAVHAMTAVIALATIVTFWPALRVPFFFDDVGDIVSNPDIRQVWPPRWLTAGPPSSNALAGRPVSALSFAIVHALAGLSPAAHHVVNLLLHGLSALLLFELIRRTLMLPRAGAHDPGIAAGLGGAAALLWALHPLQTEPVAYAVERTELLWAFFYLATLYAAVRALEPKTSRTWTAVAVAACALGMGSKEVMVSAPIAVVAFDWVFLEAEQRRSRRPLYLGLAATWAVLIALLLSGKQAAVALHADEPVSRWQYLWTQGKVITRYLRLVVWPHPLVLVYDWPQVTSFAEGLPYFLFVAALGLASAWALYRRLWAGFLGACFFMLLAPSSSIIPLPTEIAAERRMYLPAAAVLTALVIALWQGISRAMPGPSRYRVAVAVALTFVVASAVLSRHRLRDYRSTVAIWEDTTRKSPAHSTAQNNYARELIIAGRHQEAIPHLRDAIALRPDLAAPHYLLGFALVLAGDVAGGVPELRESVRLSPQYADPHFALGRVFVKAQDWEAAEREFSEALRLSPDDQECRRELAKVHHQLARIAAQAGNQPQLVEHLQSEVRVQPGSALAHINLGSALASGDQFEAAAREWLEAVRVAPEDARVRDHVVSLLRRLPAPSRATWEWARSDPSPAVRAAADASLARP
jgi:tetratricopeptide (TPR) repeat protein